MNMIILTTLFNARPYVGRCIESIGNQEFEHWRCFITDDLSTDGSAELAEALTVSDPRFEVVRNHEKLYQTGNYRKILGRADIDDDDIAVMVDGDDWLPDSRVLDRIRAAYARGQTWLTWGSYVVWPSDGDPPVVRGRPLTTGAASIRQHPWVTSHLRTCRAFLWRAIRPQDLRAPSGNYWESAGDLAFFMPMVEMAGDSHIRFLPDINYVYNRGNPLSDRVIRPEQQLHYDRLIRAMPAYSPLKRMDRS